MSAGVGSKLSADHGKLSVQTHLKAGIKAGVGAQVGAHLTGKNGPGIAGSLVERGGYEDLSGLGMVTGLVCMVVMWSVLRQFGAAQRKTPRMEPGATPPPPN